MFRSPPSSRIVVSALALSSALTVACGSPVVTPESGLADTGVPATDTGADADATSVMDTSVTSDTGVAMDTGIAPTDSGVTDGSRDSASDVVVVARARQLDLLVVMDNSGSMADNQANVMTQLGPMVDQLVNPPCRSRSNPAIPEHACDALNADDVPVYPAVEDLHVGVVSTDLGTGGFNLPGCDDSSRGDDGRLNPIRNGFSLQSHLPWAPRRPNAVTAPAGFRPMACNNDPNQFPNFIKFCSNAADASCDVPVTNASTRNPLLFTDWFKCNAGIFINGCGIEQQLESAWRALVHHDARARAGNMAPNAGFVREGAVLAIVVVSDEEDGSVRDCAFDRGFSSQGGAACADARQVFDVTSPDWASPNPDLRFYLYTPGDRRDPTWNLDRYYNTSSAAPATRWSMDFLSLKPGHPERVVFAAITGVPLAIPTQTVGGQTLTNWDALLGRPTGGANNFYGRDSSTSIAGMQEVAGPFSMRAANMDPNCSHVVPACRRQGSVYNPMSACANSQYMAYPSRRIVEIARRFDEHPACGGAPCRNGTVTSICSTNFSAAMRDIVRKIGGRIDRS